MSYRAYLNIPDLPASVSVNNLLSRTVTISGIRDIPALATVVIPLANMTEARRLRRWKALASAVTGAALAYTTPDPLAGTVSITNLTAFPQSLGYGITLLANETRAISLVNTSISRRIRLWRAITRASGNGVIVYQSVPRLSSVSPLSLDLAGGALALTGSGFMAGMTVSIGGTAATSVVVISSTQATCVAPVKTAGAQSIVLTNVNTFTSTTTAAITYTAATFASVSPTSGGVAGGTAATITGTNFKTGATVRFNGVLATSVVVVNSTTITCVTPANSAAAVNVLVTNPGTGGSTVTGTAAYTYV